MLKRANSSSRALHVVQFTDTHFFGAPHGRLMGVDTSFTFQEVKQLAFRQRGAPDFYLLTGDLSQDESEGSYRRFALAVEDFQAPAYFLPGNHDARQMMRQVFAESAAPLKDDRNFLVGDWQVVLLDSQVEKEVGGHLAEGELARLDESLAAYPAQHTLVCLHHHPLPTGATWIDKLGLDNASEFLEIIDRHANVRAVLWGHIHQQFDEMRKGVRFMATPSTCVQFKPSSRSFAVDAVAPGYRWLELSAGGDVDSGIERLSAVAAGLDLSSAGY